MKVLGIFVSVVVFVKAGLPLAARIKAYGDNIIDGIPEMESRGGEIAPVGAYPYLVGLSIQRSYKPFTSGVCGSSLVTATRLVTAAHCLYQATSLEAVLGAQYLYHEGTRDRSEVFAVHPQYRIHGVDYDIGVVVLPHPVQFTDRIQPISLPSTPEEAEVVGDWAVTAGWGIVSADQQQVKSDAQVRQMRVQVIPGDVCLREYASSTAPGNNVCTSGSNQGVACDGDSGNPLVVERNGRKILVGVTAYGADFCEKNTPVVFTRVATYLRFIQQNL